MTNPCNAYMCLEEIASCSPSGFVMKQKSIICDAFHELFYSFTAAGQQFLNCTALCKTKEIEELFQHGFKPCCGSMELWGTELARYDCMVSCNFCSVYLDNVSGFIALLDRMLPGTNPTSFYFVLCGPHG